MYWVSKGVSTNAPRRGDRRGAKPGCAAILAILAALCASRPARAGDAGGEYDIGPTKVDVTIHSWGEDCGPQPKSYTSKGKGKVTVTEDGDHLVFSNGRSTKKCWSANVTLERVSVTKKGNSWTIVCKSPATDSRQEQGTYVVTAGGDKITVKDTSVYNWKLKESVCKATIVIERLFTKSSGETPVETPPEKKPDASATIETEYPEPQPAKCKSPGPPVKLAVSPSSSTTSPGHKVCFSAWAIDGKGCRDSVAVDWKLLKDDPDRDARLEGSCFVPGESAASSEGAYRIVAEYSGLGSTVKVVVKSQFIDDLVAINLDPTQDEPPGTKPETPGAGREPELTGSETNAPAEAARRPPGFLIYVLPGVFLLVGILVVLTVALVQRKRRLEKRITELEARRAMAASGEMVAPVTGSEASRPARQRKQAHIPRSPEAPVARPAPAQPGPPMICRVCGRDFDPGSRFCPHDGSELVSATMQREGMPETGKICPRCGRGYPPGSRNCGEDGEILVPAPVADAGIDRSSTEGQQPRRSICPVCSEIYDDGSMFCGNDGIKLVPMN